MKSVKGMEVLDTVSRKATEEEIKDFYNAKDDDGNFINRVEPTDEEIVRNAHQSFKKIIYDYIYNRIDDLIVGIINVDKYSDKKAYLVKTIEDLQVILKRIKGLNLVEQFDCGNNTNCCIVYDYVMNIYKANIVIIIFNEKFYVNLSFKVLNHSGDLEEENNGR